ncbi:MAG TPA: GGDEF domain-containing protein [Pseudonocardiaceae bacterium]|nr:GGDEF domain-containing protein [Pseudonocardiaceae bacterium]
MPRHVVLYVLIVDLLAVGATAATVPRLVVTHTDLFRLAVLFGCALVYIDLSRRIERVRKLAAGAGPFVDSLTLWDFVAILVLPPALACGLIVIIHAIAWLRVWRGRRPLYRWVFSDATVLLGTVAAGLVLTLGPGPHPGVPWGVVGLGIVLAAALLRWFVNYALVIGAIAASSPGMRAGQLVGQFGEQILEAGALGLGLAAAGLIEFNPLLLVGIVIGLVALHRGVLLAQFRTASRTDAKTGLLTATWWHQITEQALSRATATGNTLGVLLLDLDFFKKINDTYGHLAGDRVLWAVGQAVRAETRDADVSCRWGGEEFAVLAPDVGDSRNLTNLAERLRRCVHSLVIDAADGGDAALESIADLTVSIGGALFPSPGLSTVDDLLMAADAALYQAKNNGRDRTHIGLSD